MFFLFGISTKEKVLDFSQTTICSNCGSYGRLEAFMTYTYFSLFFIPILKWNKKYYVRSTCCGSLYTIDNDLGKDIESGHISKIDENKLKPVRLGRKGVKYCTNCNFRIESDDYEFCPKCGMKL